MGHATIMVETNQSRVLMDPILDEFVSGGGNRIDPPRRLNKEKIARNLTAIIISHRHDDHFSPPDLVQIEDFETTPIYIPVSARLEQELRALGARNVRQLEAWQSAQVGDLKITATPSKVRFPEMGIAFATSAGIVLNLVDTVYWTLAAEIRDRIGAPKIALVPFQAGGYAEFYPLRIAGPPPGLVREIDAWSRLALEDHLAAVQIIGPEYVASFADGLCYTDASINAWHFPKPSEEFIEVLGANGLLALDAIPGTCFTLRTTSSTEVSRADDLVELEGERTERTFRPETLVSSKPMPWRDVADPRIVLGIRAPSFSDSVVAIRAQWQKANARRAEEAEHLSQSIDEWELRLCDHTTPRECRLVATFVGSEQTVQPVELHHNSPRRAYGVVIHASDLAVVLQHHLSINVILHGGHYRYWSPDDDTRIELLYERTVGTMLSVLGVT